MMKPSMTDQIKGSFHEVKGAAKEKAGKVTNNPNLTGEGQNEKLAGKVQKKSARLKRRWRSKRISLNRRLIAVGVVLVHVVSQRARVLRLRRAGWPV